MLRMPQMLVTNHPPSIMLCFLILYNLRVPSEVYSTLLQSSDEEYEQHRAQYRDVCDKLDFVRPHQNPPLLLVYTDDTGWKAYPLSAICKDVKRQKHSNYPLYTVEKDYLLHFSVMDALLGERISFFSTERSRIIDDLEVLHALKVYEMMIHKVKDNPGLMPFMQMLVNEYLAFPENHETVGRHDGEKAMLSFMSRKDAFYHVFTERLMNSEPYELETFVDLRLTYSKEALLAPRVISHEVGPRVLNLIGRKPSFLFSGKLAENIQPKQLLLYIDVVIPKIGRPKAPLPNLSFRDSPWLYKDPSTPISLATTRFIMVGLGYTGHRNTLLFDRKIQRAVYIEPHGNKVFRQKELTLMSEVVLEHLRALYGTLVDTKVLEDFGRCLQRIRGGKEDYVFVNKSNKGNHRSIQGLLYYGGGYCVSLSMLQGLVFFFNAANIHSVNDYYNVNDVFIMVNVFCDTLDFVTHAIEKRLVDILENLKTLTANVPPHVPHLQTLTGTVPDDVEYPLLYRRRGAIDIPFLLPETVTFRTSTTPNLTLPSETTVRELRNHIDRHYPDNMDRLMYSPGGRLLEHGDERDNRRLVDLLPLLHINSDFRRKGETFYDLHLAKPAVVEIDAPDGIVTIRTYSLATYNDLLAHVPIPKGHNVNLLYRPHDSDYDDDMRDFQSLESVGDAMTSEGIYRFRATYWPRVASPEPSASTLT